jgi:putative membrane protein
MLHNHWIKNDKKAYIRIGIFSIVVFTAVVILGRVKLDLDLGFNVHIFALLNAIINTGIALVLLAALWAVKSKKFQLHKVLMLTALIMSILFLVSYILHHLLSGETRFGGTGAIRIIYYSLLVSHIILAALILPFILYTAYRGLTGEYARHKKIARYTWPLWFYVAITGPIVYILISPYYQ